MASSPTHLAIKDWKTHQHYTDRRPPWIKLYTRLLDDAAFMALPEAVQAQLMKLWVLAATMGHPLPLNARLLAGKVGTRGKLYLDMLIEAGFLLPCYHGRENVLADERDRASKTLAKPYQNLTTLSTENREQRTETDSFPREAWRPIEEQRLAERLTTDAGRNALTSVLGTAERKIDVVMALHAMLDGMHPPLVPPAVMDSALIDYAANGLSSGRFNSRHFRTFTRSAAAPSDAAITKSDKALAGLNRMFPEAP